MSAPEIYFDLEDLLESYHAAQLDSGIKAKALRKKGTERYYWYLWGSFIEADAILPFNEDLLKKVIGKLPPHAELVDITIIVNEP